MRCFNIKCKTIACFRPFCTVATHRPYHKYPGHVHFSPCLAVTPLVVYICMISFVKHFIELQAGMSFRAKYKPIASFCSVDIHALPLIPKTHMFVSYILAAPSHLCLFSYDIRCQIVNDTV